MSTTDEMIEGMRKRMEELKPLVDEYQKLNRMIEAAELEHLIENDPEGFALREKSKYMSLNERIEQIRLLEKENPGATNAWIAARVGLTASRVSQIRSKIKRLDELEEHEREAKRQQKLEGMPESSK